MEVQARLTETSPNSKRTQEDVGKPSKAFLAFVLVSYIVIRAIDRIWMKRTTNAMESAKYNLMLWNIIYPITRQIVQVGFWMPYIYVMRQRGHEQYTWKWLFPGNPKVTPMGAVPLFTIGLFSLGDQLCNCLQGPAGAFISQVMLSVMSNTSIIFSLVLSAAFLGTRFCQTHYIGCILVLLSILVALSSQISSADCSPEGREEGHCLDSYKGGDGKYHALEAGAMIFWYIVFLLSILPYAVGAVYKQYVLQGRDLEVVYATWWSGCFQILWGICCLPFIWIKLPGQPKVDIGDTFQTLADTLSCLAGNAPNPEEDQACVTSPPPAFWFFIYLFFCVAFQVIGLYLTKVCSAVWIMVAAVLCLDLTNVFGQYQFIAGPVARAMTVDDWLATALASVAIWVYSLEEEKNAVKDGGEALQEDDADSDDSDSNE